MILPKAILDAPRLGCLNLHASLLPRWRGAAPIQRAIMAGDAETGVAVMKMEEGLDTGPVAMVERVADRSGDDGRRAARRPRPARRRAHGPGARGACPRRLDVHAAGRGRRHLCAQDHERGGADRLGETGAGRARPHPRPVAVSRRLLHGRPRQGRGAGQGAARGARRRQRRAGHCSSTPPARSPAANGAVRLHEVQRAGRGVVAAEEFLRGARLRPRHRLA